MSGLWRKVRRVWAICGSIALVVFVSWSLLGFRANATATKAMQGDAQVQVHARTDSWQFVPVTPAGTAHHQLLFFPGGLVDPVAYAPLAHALAKQGYFVTLMKLPRRGAFGGADDAQVFSNARNAMKASASKAPWVVAGHSKGGAVAARMANEYREEMVALVLVGTSHPRDFTLGNSGLHVTQVLGSRDPIASIERADRNRRNLPADLRRIVIDGGNHSQFGEYGFQPGDRFATIPRSSQQEQTLAVLREALTPSTH